MGETGDNERVELRMVAVTSEQARKWGAELRQVVGARQGRFFRDPFATMESETDNGARELLHGFEIGSRDEDSDVRARALVVEMNKDNRSRMAKNAANFRKFDEADPGYGAPSLAGEWGGEVKVPVLGVYGMGVKLGEINRGEGGLSWANKLEDISVERGLMGEYRRQLEEANHPELLKVLDAILVGIKEGGKKNG